MNSSVFVVLLFSLVYIAYASDPIPERTGPVTFPDANQGPPSPSSASLPSVASLVPQAVMIGAMIFFKRLF
ncbi:hypothetical protein WA026_005661 [Henosepilachna vigintioctopunctata]|uniref:Uncharacterized protein n=1 Tax=Henosepilachna vigintioctopunctata TaxID=420089 RepID=A0AAW1U1S4_9CUCU